MYAVPRASGMSKSAKSLSIDIPRQIDFWATDTYAGAVHGGAGLARTRFAKKQFVGLLILPVRVRFPGRVLLVQPFEKLAVVRATFNSNPRHAHLPSGVE